MSQAFVREEDEQSLRDISPTLTSLIRHLTAQNNGVRVYEKKIINGSNGETIYAMSDGLLYSNEPGFWQVVEL